MAYRAIASSLREGASLMTTTAVPPRQTSLLLGIFFMCAACTLFPIMNGIVQVLSRTYPSEQIIWARTTGHLLIVLALIVPRYGLSVLKSRKPGVQVSRSLLLLASTTFFFFSVKDVPLAKASSISFIATSRASAKAFSYAPARPPTMSRTLAKKSLKMLAPMIASPVTMPA
jgi:hypothetical protein